MNSRKVAGTKPRPRYREVAMPTDGAETQTRGKDYRLGFSDLEREVQIEELPVEGEIPKWLSGTLVRNGPGRWLAGETELEHWFDGLAMLHRFGFDSGRVSYANRYLKSAQYRHVDRNGEIGYAEFATDPCRSIFKRVMTTFFGEQEFGNNACVNVAEMAGRYVALTETPIPVEFDPSTLETAGVFDHDDGFETTGSSPHPHADPATGDYLNHGTHFAGKSHYKLFRVRHDGNGEREGIARIEAKEPAYMHSFGQSEHYLILAEYPLVINPLKMLIKGKPYAHNLEWRPQSPTRFWIVDKRNGAVFPPRETSPFFCFHHVNAFERDGELFVDLLARGDASVVDRLFMNRLRNPGENADAVAELRRYRIPDPEGGAGEISWEPLSDTWMELPRINYGRMAARPHRYVYGAGAAENGHGSGWLDRLVKADVLEGEVKVWREEGTNPGEPVFVEAPDAKREDDGVILSVVLDPRGDRSFLLVLSANTLEELGRAVVPHHIPHGFHGGYYPEVPGL